MRCKAEGEGEKGRKKERKIIVMGSNGNMKGGFTKQIDGGTV